MIINRIGHIIMNVITLIHYGIKYLAMRILDYQKHLKTTLDYLDKPRYISADYEDNMEYYDNPKSEVKISKWDKKTAPYCETP